MDKMCDILLWSCHVSENDNETAMKAVLGNAEEEEEE